MSAKADDATTITIASTTSTENSGLFDVLLPAFTKQSGIKVRVVAVGTGQAIKLARNGDADILFVHHRTSEEAFVADGFADRRHDVMYNDFVLVGPKEDPANIRSVKAAAKALKKIFATKAPFVSRGDESGTHKTERALWTMAGIKASGLKTRWYREVGAGMGAALNSAAAMNAYTLSDRATWLKFANKQNLTILLEGDPKLFNEYGIMLVSAKKFPHVKTGPAKVFVQWITGKAGQNLIASYKIKGQQAFFPNAQ